MSSSPNRGYGVCFRDSVLLASPESLDTNGKSQLPPCPSTVMTWALHHPVTLLYSLDHLEPISTLSRHHRLLHDSCSAPLVPSSRKHSSVAAFSTYFTYSLHKRISEAIKNSNPFPPAGVDMLNPLCATSDRQLHRCNVKSLRVTFCVTPIVLVVFNAR